MSRNTRYCLLQPAKFRLDGGAMFGIIPRPLWSKNAPPDDLNRIDLALRLLLIQTPQRVVLLDTGIGDYHGAKFERRFDLRGKGNPLEAALAEAGVEPEQVTDLVLSHLHFDHVGGIGKLVDGKMTAVLPNARCHVHRQHYDYALAPTERDAGSFLSRHFLPVLEEYRRRDLMVWHGGEAGTLLELAEGNALKFKCSHGHTPWLMHAYDQRFIYLADLIPTANHVHIPWVMGYDISPGITVAEKRIFLEFSRDNNLTIVFEHDPHHWGASVAQDDKGDWACLSMHQAQDSPAFALP